MEFQQNFVNGKEQMVVPIGSKMIFFNNLQRGEHVLFLYDQNVNPYQTFHSFITNSLKNGEICFFAFDYKDNKSSIVDYKEFIEAGRLHVFPLTSLKLKSTFSIDDFTSKISNIDRYVGTAGYTVKMLVDFGSMLKQRNIASIMECENEINRKIKESLYRKLGRAYYRYSYAKLGKYYPIAVSAFDITLADHELIEQLIGIHKKVIISSQNQLFAQLPTFVSNGHFNESPSIDTISQETMDQFIKRNLESIILFLLRQPMSGYEIIKTIFARYNVLLSQGTVYPILYSLETEGFLKTKIKDDKKTKLYTPTEDGKSAIEKRLEDFTKTLAYFIASIR